MSSLDYHKEQIKNIQQDDIDFSIDNSKCENLSLINSISIQKTREIIKLINQSEDVGAQSLKMLDEQYEKIQRFDNLTENINQNLETSSHILGKIKNFFFSRKTCKFEKIPKNTNDDIVEVKNDVNDVNNVICNDKNYNKISRNIDVKIKSEIVDKDIENELDYNLDEINSGVQNLKNIALNMNSQLDKDAQLLDRVNKKSEIVNKNINKMNKEITKVL
jgi:hypothetical protein